MSSWRRLLTRATLAVGCAILLMPTRRAQAQRASATSASQWLVLGPIPARNAAFAAANDSATLASSNMSLDHGWPAAGRSVKWLEHDSVTWTARNATVGALPLAAPPANSVVYAVTYLETDRFTRGMLSVDGVPVPRRRLWLDGARLGVDSVTLRRGKHIVMVQMLQSAGTPLSLVLRFDASTPGATITSTTDPRHAVTLEELMAATDVRDIAVDPTGKRVAWVARHDDVANDRSVSSVEVHDLVSGRLIAQLGGNNASAPRWSRDGARLAYETPTDRTGATGSDLWIWNSERGQTERVLRAERGLGPVEWSATGDWLYYTSSARLGAQETFKPGEAERLTEVWDRWNFWPEKAQLNALDPKTGTSFKIVGDTMYSVEGAKLSPDGKRIVFARSVRVPTGRPWLRGEVWVVELSDLSSRKLLDLPHEAFGAPTNFAWSPDGNAVAFCASASETLAKPDSTFSVYENELYATSVQHPALVKLSTGFIPAVSCTAEISWNAKDKRIYLSADAGARTIVARTSGPVASTLDRTPALEAVAMPGETIMAYGFGDAAMVAAIQTPTTPSTVYRIPLVDGGASATLDQPSGASLSGAVAMPTWKSWEFTNTKGAKIEAWYWLPPGFDSTKTYPMVVHYYGGTLPMKKSFDERLVWFASNGYVVFMLNPSGAPGYGQKFADLHVNDWGYPAGSDIIEGTQQFERAHAYVDARRVGNFGHSYGGFMTMHLATRTNIFATSIAIAGISNIAEYWGGGWTGYSYTDGTCPGCYPWNRRDVFVERSPLFQADKIHTPMLLIHGTSDTNVPTSESEQLFTALRMLGADAEYVRVYGENHGINSKPSVTRTLYGTMLDWYDARLRSEPAAWTARWKPTPKPAGAAAAEQASPTQP